MTLDFGVNASAFSWDPSGEAPNISTYLGKPISVLDFWSGARSTSPVANLARHYSRPPLYIAFSATRGEGWLFRFQESSASVRWCNHRDGE